MKIKILKEEVATCIAAGEVVESPACVVKELIENSLDAGAQSIYVEIFGGGFDLIRVIDNGIGLSKEEAILCLQRHATSKLSSVDDLATLQSFGFRGEALAAISSVSQIELASCNGQEATQLVVEGGKIIACSSTSREQGTTFSIKNLFYNVPARKRFQKSIRRTNTMILRLFSELALAHPDIYFSLEKDGMPLFEVPASSFTDIESYLERVKSLLGNDFSSSLVPIEAHHPIGRLFGFVTRPEQSFPYRTSQYFFLNKRSIVSSLMSKSLSEAYQHILLQGRVAGCLLFLEMDGHLVDVNVHPRKREVRFQDEQSVKFFIQDSIVNKFAIGKSCLEDRRDPVWIEPLKLCEQTAPSWHFVEKEEQKPSLQEEQSSISFENTFPIKESSSLDWARAFVAPLRTYALLDGSVCRESDPSLFPDEDWILVDCLHALFFLSQKGMDFGEKISQFLAIPIEQSFSPCLLEFIEEILQKLIPLGFSHVRSGPTEFSIHEIPSSWSRDEAKSFIEDLVQNPSSNHLSFRSLLQSFQLKKRIRLSTYTMKRLVDQIFLCLKQDKEALVCCAGWSAHSFFRC